MAQIILSLTKTSVNLFSVEDKRAFFIRRDITFSFQSVLIEHYFIEKQKLFLKYCPMEKNSVLVFGSVAYDCIETPFDKADYILGGAAAYAALASSFFAPTKILGIVGDDFNPNDLNRLISRGIDTSALEIKKGEKTFFWRGKYHTNFNKRDTLEVAVNVYENYTPNIPDEVKKTPFLLLGNIAPQSQTQVLDAMGEKPRYVVLDTMNLWIEIANHTLKDLIKRVDLFILNEDEAKQLTGEHNLIVCGKILRDMGAPSVIIKKGEHGSMLFHKDGFFAIPAYPVAELFDPTGAGDSYSGALIAYLAQKNSTDFKTLKEAILVATAVSSITVESFSCYKLEKAGLAELEKRVAYIKEITSI